MTEKATITVTPYFEVFRLGGDGYHPDPDLAMKNLRELFPDGQASDLNIVLFSTGGTHGTRTTIEEIETSLTRYPDGCPVEDREDAPDDWHGDLLTVVVVQPRIVCMHYGAVRVSLEDIPWLKQLRQSSWDVVPHIGA